MIYILAHTYPLNIFFQGTQYYRYDAGLDRVADGYPNAISAGWHGVPDYIDAVFTDETGKTYFFKSDKTYLFDDEKNHVHSDYPKLIKDVFKGIPNDIDTVLRYYYDGKVYFFKGLYYWTWNSTASTSDGPYVIKYDWKNLCLEYYWRWRY